MDDLPSVRIMDESSLVRLSNIVSDELQLLPCAFRLWEIGTIDKAFTHRIMRVLCHRDHELPVASHAKDQLINVYVEMLPVKQGETEDDIAAKAQAYRDIRAREKQWLEALRVELMKLPMYQDALLVTGTGPVVGAGGGGSTDAPAEKEGPATAPPAAATAAEIDPAEGCGIGSSNKPLLLLTSVNPVAQKAFVEEIERLDEELLTWMRRHCVDTHANASMMFFKAYDPHNMLPSPLPSPTW